MPSTVRPCVLLLLLSLWLLLLLAQRRRLLLLLLLLGTHQHLPQGLRRLSDLGQAVLTSLPTQLPPVCIQRRQVEAGLLGCMLLAEGCPKAAGVVPDLLPQLHLPLPVQQSLHCTLGSPIDTGRLSDLHCIPCSARCLQSLPLCPDAWEPGLGRPAILHAAAPPLLPAPCLAEGSSRRLTHQPLPLFSCLLHGDAACH